MAPSSPSSAAGGSGFHRLFNPRGVAIIGASAEPQRPGGNAVRSLIDRGFKGGVYPVNPKYEELHGIRCYAAVADIKEPCDVAVIALPAQAVGAAIAECGRQGIAFAVVLGGGFREAGPEGVEREAALLRTAKASGVRFIGPNCLGYVNIPRNVFAGFGSITRPPFLEPGPISAVVQSGGFGNSLVAESALAGLGFQNVVASGNETDVNAAELIQAFVDDPGTRIILAYVEGVPDGRAFMAAARHALEAGKPLIVLKGGNSWQGLRVAASHTASMTGQYDAYRAAFRQCGVIEVRDISDAVDMLLSVVSQRRPMGRNIALIGGSGGSAVNFSDAADEFGLVLAPLAARTKAVLSENLPSIAYIDNPVDYTAGFLTPANMGRLKQALTALVDDPGVDQVGLLLGTGSGPSVGDFARVAREVLQNSGKPIGAAASAAMPAANRNLFNAGAIPVVGSPRRLAASMARLADYADALRRHATRVPPEVLQDVHPPRSGRLDEHEAKQLLASYGIAITRDLLIRSDDLDRVHVDLRFPVAVKVVSPDIAHKTDVGGVQLNVADRASLVKAGHEVMQSARRAMPQAVIQGVLASEMIADALEVIVGVVNDISFGPVVAVGLGGTMAEVMRDITYRVAPFGPEEAREMIAELRGVVMLSQWRGRPARDVEALAMTVSRVSQLAWALRDALVEMDINPLLVRAAGEGVVAADALVVLK